LKITKYAISQYVIFSSFLLSSYIQILVYLILIFIIWLILYTNVKKEIETENASVSGTFQCCAHTYARRTRRAEEEKSFIQINAGNLRGRGVRIYASQCVQAAN